MFSFIPTPWCYCVNISVVVLVHRRSRRRRSYRGNGCDRCWTSLILSILMTRCRCGDGNRKGTGTGSHHTTALPAQIGFGDGRSSSIVHVRRRLCTNYSQSSLLLLCMLRLLCFFFIIPHWFYPSIHSTVERPAMQGNKKKGGEIGDKFEVHRFAHLNLSLHSSKQF